MHKSNNLESFYHPPQTLSTNRICFSLLFLALLPNFVPSLLLKSPVLLYHCYLLLQPETKQTKQQKGKTNKSKPSPLLSIQNNPSDSHLAIHHQTFLLSPHTTPKAVLLGRFTFMPSYLNRNGTIFTTLMPSCLFL